MRLKAEGRSISKIFHVSSCKWRPGQLGFLTCFLFYVQYIFFAIYSAPN